jgi:hypothetical protein
MLSLPPDSTWASPCSPLYFSSLTFNKLHLYPHVLPRILLHGTQKIWKSSDHRLHQHSEELVSLSKTVLNFL